MRPRTPPAPGQPPPPPPATPPPDIKEIVDFGEALLTPQVEVTASAVQSGPQEPTPYEWPVGTKIAILMPTNRGIQPAVLRAFAALYERDKMQFLHPGTEMALLDEGCTNGPWHPARE